MAHLSTGCRIFIGAFPTGSIAADLQAIRIKYDPKTAKISSPHVTLAGIYEYSENWFLKNEEEIITKIQDICTNIPTFEIQLGGVRIFPSKRKSIVYLEVVQTPDLLTARKELLSILGPDRHTHYTPHLTLAMRITDQQAKEMQSALSNKIWDQKQKTFSVASLQLMQRFPTDASWRTITVLQLKP